MVGEHVFISYARKDSADFAGILHDALEANGFSAWLDRKDIQPGEKWDIAIQNAIRNCWAVLFLMSPESVISDGCHDEWSLALSFRKPVLPLKVLPIEDSDIPLRLHLRQYIDFIDNFDRGMARLLQQLRLLEKPEGELQSLRTELAELEQSVKLDLLDEAKITSQLSDLQALIAFKERAIQEPETVREEKQQAIEAGIKAELEQILKAREQESLRLRQRTIGVLPQGIENIFKDRTQEVSEITNAILSFEDEIRILSIYGKGGIGKTALACRIMSELQRDYENVFGLIYLSTRTALGISLERVYLASARVLGGTDQLELEKTWVDTSSDIPAKIQVLLEHYANNRPIIILFDNFEDFLDLEGGIIDEDLYQFVSMFLRQNHNARILMTSRERLNLSPETRRFERAYLIDKGLPIEDGISLLRELDPDNTLGLSLADKENLKAIVEKTHGFPRALELFAGILAQDPFMTPQTLLDSRNVFDAEVTSNLVREAQSRLDKDSRRVMQALSVFDRPITGFAISFLLEPFFSTLDIEAAIRRLARAYYVTVHRGKGEISLHPLDKEYNYEQIPVDPSIEYNRRNLEHRAAEYYVRLRLSSDNWLTIADIEPQLAEFEHRIKAHEYDKAANLVSEIDPQLFLWGHIRRIVLMREQLIEETEDRRISGINLGQIGRAYLNLGSYDRSLNMLEQALAIAREIGDRQHEGIWLGAIGVAYRYSGKLDLAVEHTQQALIIHRDTENRIEESLALGNLGAIYRNLGQYQTAMDNFQEALAIAEDLEDISNTCLWIGNIGVVNRFLGRYREAIASLEDGIARARESRNREVEMYCMNNLGLVYTDLGEYDKAVKNYELALEIAQEIDNKRRVGSNLRGLGNAYTGMGLYEKGIVAHQQSLQIAKEIDDRRSIGSQLGNLGRVYIELGEFDKALQHSEEALEIAKQVQDRRREGEHLSQIGIVYRETGYYSNAIQSISGGLEILQEIGASVVRSSYLLELAETFLLEKNLEIAKEKASEALHLSINMSHGLLQKRCNLLLAEVHLLELDLANALIYADRAIVADEPKLTPEILTIRGIILALLDQREESKSSLMQGLQASDDFLSQAPKYYSVKYAKGLALASLAMIDEEKESASHLAFARKVFTQAQQIPQSIGIITRTKSLLSVLKPLDQRNVIDRVFEVLI